MLDSSGPKREQIGPYRILSRLGSGGMGEVYRASDTRLGREVAIKVLLDAVASDPERIARFHREARVAASLNHPNIAAIYGFEDAGDSHFLVMELVEGRSLAERLKSGPLPIDETLGIVEQIAGGLEAAHDAGIVHRDLKPSNVVLTPDGRAKILDFGVAKALDEESAAHTLEHSPTLSANLTVPGMMIGTVPYMSPEQARGRSVDRRTDIWSLGCILYECLTGRRAFEGETGTDVIAKIVERDPSWDALPGRTPMRVRELLQRCLEKDLKRRIRDAGDLRIELERAREAREWSSSGAVPAAAPARRLAVSLPWIATLAVAVAVIVAIAATGGSSSKLGSAQQRATTIPLKVDVTDPDLPRFRTTDSASVAISNDGRTMAYVGNEPGKNWRDARVCLRPVDEIHAMLKMRSPERDFTLAGPFLSPDGRWLGFTPRGIYKVPVSGGQPTLIVENNDVGSMKGAVWTERGIVFSPAAKAGLFLVGENGGTPETLTTPDASQGEVSHRWPSALPDGRHLLFTIKKEGITSFDQGEIAILDLETKSWKTVLKGGSFASYLPTGHIVYARAGAILAVPFDLPAEKVTGPPLTVLADVMTEPSSGAAQFAVAQDTGTLLYVPGGPDIDRRELVWFDRRGNITPVGAPLEPYYDPKLSPDGSQIAATIFGATDTIVVYDIARGSSFRAKTEGNCTLKAWHPDGRRLLFSSDAQGARRLYLTEADGTGTPRPVLPDVHADTASMFATTGEGVGVVHAEESGLYLSLLDGDPQRRRLSLESEVAPVRPALSRDGRWIAYDIDVSGQRDVYVRPFPTGNGTWQISRGGGISPRWSPSGDEVLYLLETPGGEASLMSVRLKASASGLSASAPTELAKIPNGVEILSFDPNGQRLLAARSVPPQYKGDRVVAILNWFDEVRTKVPTK